MFFTKTKISWIYCIIVKSLSIDLRKREKEKRCTSISLDWTERTLPGENIPSSRAPLKGCPRIKDAHTGVQSLDGTWDSAGWNAQHNHQRECSVTWSLCKHNTTDVWAPSLCYYKHHTKLAQWWLFISDFIDQSAMAKVLSSCSFNYAGLSNTFKLIFCWLNIGW